MLPFHLLPLAALAVAGAFLSGCAAPSQLGGGERGRLAGRVYVVTGASSGFGRGVAVKLGGYGAHVVLAARRAAVLEEVAAEVRAGGGQALVVPTDVADEAAVEQLARAAVERFGRIDVWINNAAVASIGRFEEVPVADHARIVDVNLKGAIYGTHAAIRQFREQGGGVVVNVSSVEGRVPMAYHASYASTKAALLALGGAINQEMRLARTSTIKVANVLPWAVDTPFWVHAGNYTGRQSQVATMEGPEGVVDAIIWVSLHPVQEYAVGWKAQGAVIGAQIWPSLARDIAGGLVHRSQIEEAPPGPVTSGSVHEPVPQGTGVGGGIRARMEADRQGRAP
ncbi:SDR family NAD(P)-dependent oxidoreductase [Roseomonas sp. SSH11]|uniref:SDR family NAD(P)-dependent oxidoreductase n=1 Tax=Pararoseomonas baculiformis TaxID=2820812 RepID=A0ABS4AHG7_9PROT|nr:SDR family NAD(P)-dependent oxidoreductase [Pararoseomonas baculiformis]MBP0446472.1 SDR family NAD(P)-dependent oxidoreductase [Pararoseomonas baculiformis]